MEASRSASNGSLFRDEEIKDIAGVVKGMDYVEVTCGCTSRKYGDYVGRLKIFESGDLEVKCECIHNCEEDILTPTEFEKHARSEEVQKRWKQYIWVTVRGRKVPLFKTPLLKYYNKAEKASGLHRGHSARAVHRDEFIRCVECGKERRFRLQTKEDCRVYHDANADKLQWKCSDFPLSKISCDNDEERASRRAVRGCPRAALCKGCTTCVCFGCEMCRYPDCSCQECSDFMKNADI